MQRWNKAITGMNSSFDVKSNGIGGLVPRAFRYSSLSSTSDSDCMESVRSDDDEFIDELELSAVVRESEARLLKTISNE